jgi:hypothetical protein
MIQMAKRLGFFTVGAGLLWLGLLTLGVPSDQQLWRIVAGVGLFCGSLICFDRA